MTSGKAISSYSRHYPQITKEFSGQIKKTAEKIQSVLTKSNEQENTMCGDLKVLKKYVGIRYRLKTAWGFRNNNKKRLDIDGTIDDASICVFKH